jgi:DNA/RNA-binding domain of Phe-tRNA-synthetase-like protein
VAVTLSLTPRWQAVYPGARVAVLALRGVDNGRPSPELLERAHQLEHELRARHSHRGRTDLRSLPGVRPYAEYYKGFGKTYHVLLQLESVVLQNRPISAPSPLVLAMLMAELAGGLLTAGHDREAVQGELAVDVADGSQSYTVLRGTHQPLKAGDMYLRDEIGVLSSILYGPDFRTRITDQTGAVVFTVYAPAGVSTPVLEAHLDTLEAHARLVSPQAEVETRGVFPGEQTA